jgi:polyhydroxyalkanoate synthesis repressor PhaR
MSDTPRIIRKYPNRRLYDTASDGYITLADVKQLVLAHVAFQVVDAKSGADLTRAILLQIILDEESGATPMFSSEMLAQFVRFHGAAQQTMVGTYLEENVNMLLGIQKKLQERATQSPGDAVPLTPELWRQLMQLQAPAMQAMLGDFLEQSVKRFIEKK